MNSFDINQALRYGVSGGFGVFVLLLSFSEPQLMGRANANMVSNEWIAILLSFMIGAIVYAAYRSVLFPPIYRLACTIVGRHSSLGSIDIARWRRLESKDSGLQKNMSEWGSQIHLLNTCAISGLSMIFLGSQAGLSKTNFHNISLRVCLLLLLFGLISLIRYEIREMELFDGDQQP